MPELPEVETVVRGLEPHLPGRKITAIRLGKTDFIDDAAALETILPGSRILSLHRHGKFIVCHLEKSSGEETGIPARESRARRFDFVVHLGMTGQLTVHPANAPAPPHTHVWISLDSGAELRYTDTRRFGRMFVLPGAESEAILAPLGLDPLEAREEEFRERLRSRRARIKAVLLDQRVFRGMGNIYTDESLWRARIHPARIAANLTREEISRLYRAVQNILREAIRLGGSSISDYVNAEGRPGEFQIRHRAYGREGKKCGRCGGVIRRMIVAGRSSYFCPRCQHAPRKSKPRR